MRYTAIRSILHQLLMLMLEDLKQQVVEEMFNIINYVIWMIFQKPLK